MNDKKYIIVDNEIIETEKQNDNKKFEEKLDEMIEDNESDKKCWNTVLIMGIIVQLCGFYKLLSDDADTLVYVMFFALSGFYTGISGFAAYDKLKKIKILKEIKEKLENNNEKILKSQIEN